MLFCGKGIQHGFATPALYISSEPEVSPSKPRVKPEVASGQVVVDFFNPVTCQPKENQKVSACQAGEDFNKTLCLKHNCCVPSKKHAQLDCYMPFPDRPQRILRLFGIGGIGVLFIGCLPCCCCIVEKSPCANPLRRATKEEESEEESDDNKYENEGSSSKSDEYANLVQSDAEKSKYKENQHR
ncbi:FMR1 neighbor protein isoform X2 [Hemicordylus capensis]|uniref:FMR1 neighbor protein isoform X2 n=1 Tax=Hemicordylus capensis TaxID=884348 RepID=UPI0023049A28|nr:FMR1 neighbor protein isoform X2 [Hemicordylus capensis]